MRCAPRSMTMRFGLMAVLATMAVSDTAVAGLFGTHGDRGASLYPGRAPIVGPYDGAVPGWRPPGFGDAGPSYPIYHPWGHHPMGPSVPALWRYPCFGGYIPPAPHDDCLYQSGTFPWRRG